MTARRKPDSEEIILRMDGKTLTFRSMLILMVMSATPFGQTLLATWGISSPSTLAASKAHEDIEAVRKDVAELKSDVGNLKLKVDKIEYRVTGFAFDPKERK